MLTLVHRGARRGLASINPKGYDRKDPFLLESRLTEGEVQVKDMVRSYAESKLLPRVVQAYRDGSFDKAIMKEMGELGLLGSTIQGYGCSGVSYVSYGLAAREVSPSWTLSFFAPSFLTTTRKRWSASTLATGPP